MEGLKEAFNKICKMNDAVIKAGKAFTNCYFLIKEDGKIDIVNLHITSKEDKTAAREELFKNVGFSKAKGYILVMRTMITNEGKKEDCVFRALYSIDDRINEKVTFEENKIVGRERLFGRDAEDPVDFWDLWQTGNIQ